MDSWLVLVLVLARMGFFGRMFLFLEGGGEGGRGATT